MTAIRQSWIGMTLAVLIMVAWLCLHVIGLFFIEEGTSLPLQIGLIAVLTWLSVGLFIISHDAMHGSLCPVNQRIGKLTGAMALLLYAGFSFQALNPKHHLHHRSPGSADDPDFAFETPDQPFAWYGRFMVTYFRLRELIMMTLRVGAYLLLGASMPNILLFFALPAILSSLQLFYFGTFRPHRHPAGTPAAGFADHHNARSDDFHPVASLLSCFHFGYHHEHHLQPGTPWWGLPAARSARILQAAPEKHVA